LARYHILSGEKNPLQTYKLLTGKRGYKPLSGLPTKLNRLKNLVFPDHTVEELIDGHTHFNYYAPFISKERRFLILKAMKESGATKSRLGLLRNHIGAAEPLRYCESCYRGEITENGFPYWHREHLLPSVFVCPYHEEPLKEVDLSRINYHERAPLLPGNGYSVIQQVSEVAFKKLVIVSQQTLAMLNSKLDGRIDQGTYRKLLRFHNFVTGDGHIRQKELYALVDTWLSDLTQLTIFNHLRDSLKVERSWLSTMVADKREFHHPIKHLIVLGALGLTYNDAIYTAMEEAKQLELVYEFKGVKKLTREDIVKSISSEGSLTRAAKKLGCCLTTLIVEMEKNGISYNRKTQYITEQLKRRLLTKAKGGMKTSDLASYFKISVSSVNRILRSGKFIRTFQSME